MNRFILESCHQKLSNYINFTEEFNLEKIHGVSKRRQYSHEPERGSTMVKHSYILRGEFKIHIQMVNGILVDKGGKMKLKLD